MSMIDQFQKLDDLIILHTKPPVTAILRGQLALTREQIEAYQASSDKQDQTLAAQIETIDSLMKKYEALVSKQKQSDTAGLDALRKEAADYQAMLRSKQLRTY